MTTHIKDHSRPSYLALSGIHVHYQADFCAVHARTDSKEPCAILFDLDNTKTDSRRWFGGFILPALEALAKKLGVEFGELCRVYTDIVQKTTLHEYAFVVETIAASWAGGPLNRPESLVQEARLEFWAAFDAYHAQIETFPGVVDTIRCIQSRYPNAFLITWTDSPRDVAINRSAIIGTLPLIDGLISVESPVPSLEGHPFPGCVLDSLARLALIDETADKQHLLLDVGLAPRLAKPSEVGPRLVSNWIGAEPSRIVLVGDSPGKEGLAGHNWERELGLPLGTIPYLCCEYGQVLEGLHMQAADIITSLPKQPPSRDDVKVRADLSAFPEILDHLPSILADAAAAAGI